jgi:hypothetical protein
MSDNTSSSYREDPPFEGVSDEALKQAPAPGAPDGGKSKTIATVLVALARHAGVELFHDADQTPYATVMVGDHNETYPIHSPSYRKWLSLMYYQRTDSAANANALPDAVNVLAAIATHDGAEIPVATRVLQHGENIYLDLADNTWRVLEILRDGWRVLNNSPVKCAGRRECTRYQNQYAADRSNCSGLSSTPKPRRGSNWWSPS